MVKISSIEASAHSRPFEGDVLRNALGANIKRDFVLVKVTADDGTVGYGEAHHGQNPTAMAEIHPGRDRDPRRRLRSLRHRGHLGARTPPAGTDPRPRRGER